MAEGGPQSEHPSCILFVGQDRSGRWLVQESAGRMEGRFVSREAAIAFARAERLSFEGAQVVMAVHPLTPTVSLDPVTDPVPMPAKAA